VGRSDAGLPVCREAPAHDHPRQKLRRPRLPLERFLEESAGLGQKRGPLLVQLPPSLSFESRVAARFFDVLRERYQGSVVCEPRHETQEYRTGRR
jgi:uncharacterized protein YecE (DUF72 family)